MSGIPSATGASRPLQRTVACGERLATAAARSVTTRSKGNCTLPIRHSCAAATAVATQPNPRPGTALCLRACIQTDTGVMKGGACEVLLLPVNQEARV